MKDLLDIISIVTTISVVISFFSFMFIIVLGIGGDHKYDKVFITLIIICIISTGVFIFALIYNQKITNSTSSHTHYTATKIQVKRWKQLNSGDYEVLTTNNKIITISNDEDKTKININTSLKYDKPHALLTKYTATNRNYLKQLDTDIPTEYYKLTIHKPDKDATNND